MQPLFSFGIITDCQYRDTDNTYVLSPDGRHQHLNHYRESPAKLREAIATYNQHDLQFVVHLGDFVDKTIDEADILLDELDRLNAPFWHVLGNHDFIGSKSHKEDILVKYDLENGYYSNILNGYRFIILDTNDLGVNTYEEGTSEWRDAQERLDAHKNQGHINAYPWNGGLGAEQLGWLDNQLDQASRNEEKVILFAHHPIFPPHQSNALNDNEILAVIEKYTNVVAFINGHNHFGAVGVRRQIPYITIPAVLEGTTNAYGIVDICADRIRIHGYGRVQDMEFAI